MEVKTYNSSHNYRLFESQALHGYVSAQGALDNQKEKILAYFLFVKVDFLLSQNHSQPVSEYSQARKTIFLTIAWI